MINAQEALEMSREAVKKKYEHYILEATALGKRSVEICKEISEDEISILKENEYDVVVEEKETQGRKKVYISTIKW